MENSFKTPGNSSRNSRNIFQTSQKKTPANVYELKEYFAVRFPVRNRERIQIRYCGKTGEFTSSAQLIIEPLSSFSSFYTHRFLRPVLFLSKDKKTAYFILCLYVISADFFKFILVCSYTFQNFTFKH